MEANKPFIRHIVHIAASPEKVFAAVTEQDHLSKWWIADCNAKPVVGHVNEFRIKDVVENHMKITQLVPNEFVEWECLKSSEEWIGTTVKFIIKTEKDLTILDFRHENWRAMTDYFAICNFHWARHLNMLKDLCETDANQINEEKEASEVEKVKK